MFKPQYAKQLSFCTGIAYIFFMTSRKQRFSGEEWNQTAKIRRHPRVRAFITLVLLAILIISAIQMFSKFPDMSDPVLRVSTSAVDVHSDGKDIYFMPHGAENASLGFIMYPGAKVPKEAYSYLARSLAEAGYPAVLLDAPLGFAIFDVGAASRPAATLPGIRTWVLAGHSLGGVAAALFAKKHLDIVSGIVFLASYPPGGGSLAEARLQVLSISASNDMLATREKIEKARRLLPESTRYVRISGGNHALFGDYGSQRGDGAAEITSGRQQGVVVDSVLALLASLQ